MTDLRHVQFTEKLSGVERKARSESPDRESKYCTYRRIGLGVRYYSGSEHLKRLDGTIFGLALCAVALLGCSRKPQTRGAAATARPQTNGKLTTRVMLSAQQVLVNQPVLISYIVENAGDSGERPADSNRADILTPLDSEWLKSGIQPGEVATVARTVLRPESPGMKLISGKLITDHDTLEPVPVSLVVNSESRTAILESLRAVIDVNPDSLPVNQPTRVTYKLRNATSETIAVISIQTDSPMPITSADPNWVSGRVCRTPRA